MWRSAVGGEFSFWVKALVASTQRGRAQHPALMQGLPSSTRLSISDGVRSNYLLAFDTVPG